MKILIILLFCTACMSCHRNEDDVLRDAQGAATRLPHAWKSSVSLDGGLTTTMHAQHIYQNKYLLTAQRVGPKTADNLCFKNVETGENKWVWSDRFNTSETSTLFKNYIYSYQNLLFYNYGSRSYCIDQETGKTVWKQEWTPGISQVRTTKGFGNHFYFTGTPPEIWQQKVWDESIYQGDMQTGQIRPIAKLKAIPGKFWNDPSGLKLYSIGGRLSFLTNENDTLVLVSYELPDPRPQFTSVTSGYISLYNLTRQKWVYEQIPLVNQDETGGGGWPVLINDKIYFTLAMWVGCFDVFTGKRIWMKRLTEASLFSDLILADGKLLANGQNAKLYSLDPATGNVLWTQESSAIGSSLYQQDGVVYYIASQKLKAVEVATGRLLWNLDCPDYYTINRGDSWFSGFVTGLPATGGKKGRIFASTNLNVYSFEAAK